MSIRTTTCTALLALGVLNGAMNRVAAAPGAAPIEVSNDEGAEPDGIGEAPQDPAVGRRARGSYGGGGGQTAAPPVAVICRAAVALALAEPERARGFIRRARVAGWLPEIHFRVYRRFARTEGLTFADIGGGTVAPVDIDAVDDVRYEWRASWDLSRMVFNPDELQAHIEALRMADVRRDIQSLVIKLYFERLRLLSDQAPAVPGPNAGTPPGSNERRQLRVAEIEAQLDAMSAGAFSEGGSARREAAATP